MSLTLFFEQQRRGEAISEVEFIFGPERRFQPDVAVVLEPAGSQADLWKSPSVLIPALVIEVISLSESASRVDRKIKAYLEAGVAEVIVVYPETNHAYVISRTSSANYWSGDTLTSAAIPGWSIRVDDVFATH